MYRLDDLLDQRLLEVAHSPEGQRMAQRSSTVLTQPPSMAPLAEEQSAPPHAPRMIR